MLITDKKIRELVKDRKLIAPFSEDLLQSESYDVTIGNKVILFRKDKVHCLDIAKQSDIDSIYQEIDISENGYVISPSEYILVQINEKIDLPDDISAHIRPKTRCTRLGLIVSGQHCNSSYAGTLRLGLFNATDYPIRIRQGYSIAQLVFEELNEVASDKKLYRIKESAHYQNENGEFRGAKFDDVFLEKVMGEILNK
jgi:dCTP deaminase